MIHCDAGPRVVRAYPVEKDGAGYKAEHGRTSSPVDDSWYRPADVCVAPDGSVYIADWHDAGVGGHNMADRALQTMTGRVIGSRPRAHKPSVAEARLDQRRRLRGRVAVPESWPRAISPGLKLARDASARPRGNCSKLWKGSDPRAARPRASSARAHHGPRKELRRSRAQGQDADIRITGLRIARSLEDGRHPAGQEAVATIPPPKSAANAPSRCATTHRPKRPSSGPRSPGNTTARTAGISKPSASARIKQENKFFDAWLAAVGDQLEHPGRPRHHLALPRHQSACAARQDRHRQDHTPAKTQRVTCARSTSSRARRKTPLCSNW